MNIDKMNEIILNQYEQEEKYNKNIIQEYKNKIFICKCCKKNFKIINKNGIINRYDKIKYYLNSYWGKQNLMCFKCAKS
jgi:hypothetical protein